MNYQELLAKRKQLQEELLSLNVSIQQQLGLPNEWEILPPDLCPMAGGVGLIGPCTDNDQDEQVTICVSGGSQYGPIFFLQDESHRRSLCVDPEAVRAALRAYDLQRGVE